MNTKTDRIPLGEDEIVILNEPELPASMCQRLLDFYGRYHERNLTYFLTIKAAWNHENPGQLFPGLCANVNPLTGELRPDHEQRLWGWGDGRALGTWSSFLNAGRVPPTEVTIAPATGAEKVVDLRAAMREYVDLIHDGLKRRLEINGGRIPFASHYQTGEADRSPRFSSWDRGDIDFCSIFAGNGFMQYGMYRRNEEAFALGMELIENQVEMINAHQAGPSGSHGPRMILLGAIGEVLKSLQVPGNCDAVTGANVTKKLIETALPFIEYIIEYHYKEDPVAFWERTGNDGEPERNQAGSIVVDPGHATECSGFLAELVPFLPLEWGSGRWNPDRVLETARTIHLFADGIGFTEAGVMTKYADLETGAPLPDTQAVPEGGVMTAPWFNIREHSAAALRLYTLKKDDRLLESYRKAQNASYLHYPNKRIGGQMVQTLDPFTLEAVDVQPATGNLDPMHDGRSRIREMENLELLLREP